MPERAVIDTGSKKVVYVEREPGLFEGVEVELGPRHGEYYPVVKGLKPGDKVAAAGGFLIDAETRLNPAAASTYFGASGGPQSSDRPSAAPLPAGTTASKPLPIKTSRTRQAERAEPRVRSPRRMPKTSRTSSNCPRPTGRWRLRSALARSPALRWARWAFPSRSPFAARRSFCAAKAASARRSEIPTKR